MRILKAVLAQEKRKWEFYKLANLYIMQTEVVL